MLRTRQDPLGPIMLARAELFQARGLLEPGVLAEQLAVIRARAPRTARFVRAPERDAALTAT